MSEHRGGGRAALEWCVVDGAPGLEVGGVVKAVVKAVGRESESAGYSMKSRRQRCLATAP